MCERGSSLPPGIQGWGETEADGEGAQAGAGRDPLPTLFVIPVCGTTSPSHLGDQGLGPEGMWGRHWGQGPALRWGAPRVYPPSQKKKLFTSCPPSSPRRHCPHGVSSPHTGGVGRGGGMGGGHRGCVSPRELQEKRQGGFSSRGTPMTQPCPGGSRGCASESALTPDVPPGPSPVVWDGDTGIRGWGARGPPCPMSGQPGVVAAAPAPVALWDPEDVPSCPLHPHNGPTVTRACAPCAPPWGPRSWHRLSRRPSGPQGVSGSREGPSPRGTSPHMRPVPR